MAWLNDRYEFIRKDRQKEEAEIGSSEANESTLYIASGSEDARAHLEGASIDLDGVAWSIITAASTGEG